MSSLFEKLLTNFNLTIEDYRKITAEPSFSNIPTLDIQNNDVQNAKEIVLDAIRTHKKVIIYGDYDCDGIMSTSIIKKALMKLGCTPATYVPSRYIDGYGINKVNAIKIAQASYDLVILVDNGITAFEGIEELKSHNIKVVAIDHHELGDTLPNCDAILHPETLKYGSYPISAGYLSFLFSITLLNEVDEYLLTLGALSTLSDMMPLKGHNREIVRLAINLLNKNHYPVFELLNEGKKFDYSNLSMNVIPSINAIGRMVEDTTINRLISCFTETDFNKTAQLVNWMKEINDERKELTKRAKESIKIDENDAGLALISDLKEGLNGLLANQLLNQYKKCCVVFSKSVKEKGLLIGSIRTKEGMSVIDFFSDFKPYLVAFGGHAYAGGLTIKEAEFESFKKQFIKYCFNHPITFKNNEIDINLDDINKENLDIFYSFAPFGQEWPEPKLTINNVKVENLMFVKNDQVLCTNIKESSKILSFSISKDSICDKLSIDLIGSLRLNEWKGTSTVEYICEEKK